MQLFDTPASFKLIDLQPSERPDPGAPGPGQVLVRMRAVALNYRDLLVVQGQDRWLPPIGRVPVSDGVGIVEAIGVGVDRFRVGQRVISTILPNWIDGPLTDAKQQGGLGGPSADGVLAELVLFDADALVSTPAYLSDVEAATLPVAALTAWHALTRANSLRPGATILVQGSGGVSLFALQFGLAAGARVYATSSSDAKLDRMRELGTAGTANYRTAADWDVEILGMTDGRGVDHVIDIGGASTLSQSLNAVAFGGIVSVVGLVGGLKAQIDVAQIFQKNMTLHGIETGSRTMFEAMLDWMEAREIHPIVGKTFSFEKTQAAFFHQQASTGIGKTCIVF